MLLTYLPDAVAHGAHRPSTAAASIAWSWRPAACARARRRARDDGHTPTGAEVVIEARRFILRRARSTRRRS